jgi:hypothetical protein
MLRRFDLMVRSLLMTLAVALLALAAGFAPAGAQEGSQLRYIEELKQRNADYGPGCNGIGISTPREVNMPADISTRWAGGHSACIPGLRLVAACIGEVSGSYRLIGCTLQVADGESAASLGCQQLTLIAPDTRLHPNPELSDILSGGSDGAAASCATPSQLASGATIAAAFRIPVARSPGDLALLIDLDGSEVPAFLIPASQLGGMPAAS